MCFLLFSVNVKAARMIRLGHIIRIDEAATPEWLFFAESWGHRSWGRTRQPYLNDSSSLNHGVKDHEGRRGSYTWMTLLRWIMGSQITRADGAAIPEWRFFAESWGHRSWVWTRQLYLNDSSSLNPGVTDHEDRRGSHTWMTLLRWILGSQIMRMDEAAIPEWLFFAESWGHRSRGRTRQL